VWGWIEHSAWTGMDGLRTSRCTAFRWHWGAGLRKSIIVWVCIEQIYHPHWNDENIERWNDLLLD
jgi:hypothetical protein